MPRKKKNRRRERRHVLDVKLSSNQIRRRRAQLAFSAVFAVVFLTVTVYGLWRGGWWAVQRFVYHNEELKIREFVIRTDGVIDRGHLERWSGVKLGDNLFAIDLHDIKRHLEMHDMIRQASLERRMPGTLLLQVSEREPLARVRLHFSAPNGHIVARDFGLDRTGRVMPLDQGIVRPETVQSWLRLPQLTGLDERKVIPGTDLTNEPARAALEFLDAFNDSPVKRLVQIAAIDLSEPAILRVRTTRGSEVEMLDRDFPRQLARWEAIHNRCLADHVGYAWVDLSPTNNIPLRTAPLALISADSRPPNP